MFPVDTRMSARWLPLDALLQSQHERRSLERVRFYYDLLIANPDQALTPITVKPHATYPNAFVVLDGHHRTAAYLLAGRTHIPAVVLHAHG